MKLASYKDGRDGRLMIVSRDLSIAAPSQAAQTLQYALDAWAELHPVLQKEYDALNAGQCSDAISFDQKQAASPLPRAYQWADGSAYVNHVELVRKARGAEMPASFWHDPLMYQGGSDHFLAPHDDIVFGHVDHGLDMEA